MYKTEQIHPVESNLKQQDGTRRYFNDSWQQDKTRRYFNDSILITVITTTSHKNIMSFFCNYSPAKVLTLLKANTNSSVWWSHSLVSSCSLLTVTDNTVCTLMRGSLMGIFESIVICGFCSLNLQAKLSCLAGPSSYSWYVMDHDNDEGTWKKMISASLDMSIF